MWNLSPLKSMEISPIMTVTDENSAADLLMLDILTH